jgi:hypothetical protein
MFIDWWIVKPQGTVLDKTGQRNLVTDLFRRTVPHLEDQPGRDEPLSVRVGGDAAATPPKQEPTNEKKVRSAHPTQLASSGGMLPIAKINLWLVLPNL